VGCEAEIDYKDREGSERKERTLQVLFHITSLATPATRRGNRAGIKLQWRRVSPSEAPPEAKLPPAHATSALQSRHMSFPLYGSLHAQGRLSTTPSRLAAEEMAAGWLAGGDHKRTPALEPCTFSRGKRTAEEIQSTRNTGQSIKRVPRFAVVSSVNPVLPFGFASAHFHVLFTCRDTQ